MNCKNVEPLLSLYTGGDLEEERLRLVAAHLQSCTECTLAADEYAEASQLLQAYEPPVFSDEVYAGIRAQVLHEIEREFCPPVWHRIFSQFFLTLVQPRMRLITAALLLAISVSVLFFSRNHSQLPNDKQVAVQTAEPNQGGRGADVRTGNTGASSVLNKGRLANTPRPIIGKRRANAGVVAANRSRELDKTTKVVQGAIGVSQPSSTPAPLRVEMQTSDRNIRIIWLSGQRPVATGRDGSKGI